MIASTLPNFDAVAAVLSSAAAGIAFIVSAYFQQKWTKGIRLIAYNESPKEDWEAILRLPELRQIKTYHEKISTWMNRVSSLLIFGQIVVGGALASSFAQDTLNAKTTSFFGLLVIVSTLIHKAYRPDLHAKNSTAISRRISALIRFSEDEILISETKDNRKQYLLEFRKKVTESLNNIEQSDLFLGDANSESSKA